MSLKDKDYKSSTMSKLRVDVLCFSGGRIMEPLKLKLELLFQTLRSRLYTLQRGLLPPSHLRFGRKRLRREERRHSGRGRAQESLPCFAD